MFLKVKNRRIVDGQGRPFQVKGVNCGGWYMWEGYFMQAPNYPAKRFRKNFTKECGAKALQELTESFYDTWYQKKDFTNIKKLGFNTVRLPFQYSLVETRPGVLSASGMKRLDKAVKWAKQSGLKVILDLHGAPGSQNHDWHSDSDGQAKLWTNPAYRKRVYRIWKNVADYFKDEQAVLGYDLLNESVMGNPKLLNDFYKECIKSIRSVDSNHIIFIEGNNWATDIKCLDKFDDDNYVLSIHFYEPLDVTFNFVPNMNYPIKKSWNKALLKKAMLNVDAVAKKHNVPVFVGEFGVNYRDGKFGEVQWLEDVLDVFRSLNFHWTYWTYKAVKNTLFPDGVYSYYPNAPWVHRHGPLSGWDTYHLHWKTKKKQMIASWDSKQFSANTEVVKVLKNAVKKN